MVCSRVNFTFGYFMYFSVLFIYYYFTYIYLFVYLFTHGLLRLSIPLFNQRRMQENFVNYEF